MLCKGSVRQLAECRVSLVFLELCFFSVTFQGKLNGVAGALCVSVCFCAAELPSRSRRETEAAGRAPEGDATPPTWTRGSHLSVPWHCPLQPPRLCQPCPQTSSGRARDAVASCPTQAGEGAMGQEAHGGSPSPAAQPSWAAPWARPGQGCPAAPPGCSARGPSRAPWGSCALSFPRERRSCGQVTRCDRPASVSSRSPSSARSGVPKGNNSNNSPRAAPRRLRLAQLAGPGGRRHTPCHAVRGVSRSPSCPRAALFPGPF